MADEVTPGEAVRLYRHRRRLTQRAFALRVGLTRRQLQYVEEGRRPFVAERVLRRLRAPSQPLDGPDLCLLYRWRSKTSTTDLAEALGVSRVTLLVWEKAGDPRLFAHWVSTGVAK